VIWVASHSGPETAEDSRTHFGIFAPGVTQLFPRGHVINLHPWEHNDVAPARALGLTAVRLHRGPHAEQAIRADAERADIDACDLTEAARRLVAWREALAGA